MVAASRKALELHSALAHMDTCIWRESIRFNTNLQRNKSIYLAWLVFHLFFLDLRTNPPPPTCISGIIDMFILLFTTFLKNDMSKGGFRGGQPASREPQVSQAASERDT